MTDGAPEWEGTVAPNRILLKTSAAVFAQILLDDKNPLVNGFSHLRKTSGDDGITTHRDTL